MERLHLSDVSRYVETNIGEFHQRRIQNLEKLKLLSVLRRKNPYLFRAKNVLTADQIIKGLVDSHIASHEETIFGNWLEGLAIFVNQMVYGGRKSGMTGIDLEFETENRRYIVAIKSGPNWGNSSQVSKMKTDFRTAMKTLRTSNSQLNIVAVNGCCYGKENTPDKGDYFKYCGQKFWEFISGDNDLFTEIIEPLGYKAKEKNEEFLMAYSQTLNKFTREFANRLCDDNGKIDWEKLVRLNSARNENVSDS
ncbi:MAG: PmeII family type II restriction endonuclease [Nitrospira sp.]|nr:PmeII family type II restriction endonuclease [Nitrospira sp.]